MSAFASWSLRAAYSPWMSDRIFTATARPPLSISCSLVCLQELARLLLYHLLQLLRPFYLHSVAEPQQVGGEPCQVSRSKLDQDGTIGILGQLGRGPFLDDAPAAPSGEAQLHVVRFPARAVLPHRARDVERLSYAVLDRVVSELDRGDAVEPEQPVILARAAPREQVPEPLRAYERQGLDLPVGHLVPGESVVVELKVPALLQPLVDDLAKGPLVGAHLHVDPARHVFELDFLLLGEEHLDLGEGGVQGAFFLEDARPYQRAARHKQGERFLASEVERAVEVVGHQHPHPAAFDYVVHQRVRCVVRDAAQPERLEVLHEDLFRDPELLAELGHRDAFAARQERHHQEQPVEPLADLALHLAPSPFRTPCSRTRAISFSAAGLAMRASVPNPSTQSTNSSGSATW